MTEMWIGPDERQLEYIRSHLWAVYNGKKVQAAKAALDAGDEEEVEDAAKDLIKLEEIEFVSVRTRGTKEVVVRLEIKVRGQAPPDGRSVRYWRMRRSMLGWTMEYETTALAYYLKLY